jgi:hypothetical protein
MSERDDDRKYPDGGANDSGAGRTAKEELFEAIDHFKNAASILFERATKDPTVRSATKEAERIARKISDAAEPLAKQLTTELNRLTRDVMQTVEGRKPKRRAAGSRPRKTERDDEE